MIWPEAGRSGPQLDRAVIGEIHGGTRPVLDPVAERAASLVGDLTRRDDESVDLAGALGDMSEGPLPVEVCRRDREMRRGHHVGEVVRRGTGLLGDVDVDSSVGPVTCREEGQALQVVPVEVAEQDRATERLTSQQVGDLANPGAGVDDQPGRPVGVTDGDRCRVAAIAAELETRGGGRTPNPAYVHPHGPASGFGR